MHVASFAHVTYPPPVPATPASLTKPSQSAEDYLERIHELIEAKGSAHVADIAQSLNVGQPSVTSMVQKLADDGYLRYEKYRSITLTDAGRAVALRIRDRHIVLASFFTLFGLDDETQARDIEGIEHHLSPDTLKTFADLTEFFQQNPKTLTRFQSSRNSGKTSPKP
ncbi:MAG: transcriptional regulator MntR [Verrucomicrobia subdivision 3 bacterium]|nr:transcriptional regulator MntR [Limisphaerales bacterium]